MFGFADPAKTSIATARASSTVPELFIVHLDLVDVRSCRKRTVETPQCTLLLLLDNHELLVGILQAILTVATRERRSAMLTHRREHDAPVGCS